MGSAQRPAIIFDLDDTLFDCREQLVHPAHREATEAMIKNSASAHITIQVARH